MVMHRPSALDWVCFALLIIGAINWGLIGVVDINLVTAVLEPVFSESAAEMLTRIVYAIVGLAGVYFFYPLFRVFNKSRDEQAVR